MTDKPTVIPDVDRLLLVAFDGRCSLFLDGKRVTFIDREPEMRDKIKLDLTTQRLARLADVQVITNVDSRVIIKDPTEKTPRWWDDLEKVIERQEQINEALRLKQEAHAATRRAAELEAHR